MTHTFTQSDHRILKFAFNYPDILPVNLIDSSVTLMRILAQLGQRLESVTQGTLASTLDNIINSLLDDRLAAASAQTTMKAVNKLALRYVQNPPPNTSMSVLLSLQTIAVGAYGTTAWYSSKRIKVISKLANKVVANENDKNPDYPFESVDLDEMLPLMDECLRVVNSARSKNPGSDSVKPADDMTRMFLTELIKSKKELVRDTVERLGLRDSSFRQLLNDCEFELGIDGSALASLIQRVGESNEDERAAAVAELNVFKESSPDMFESHMNNLSAPFREFITDQLNRHLLESKEGCISEDQVQNVDPPASSESNELQPAMASRDSFTDLRARIEALKNRNACGD